MRFLILFCGLWVTQLSSAPLTSISAFVVYDNPIYFDHCGFSGYCNGSVVTTRGGVPHQVNYATDAESDYGVLKAWSKIWVTDAPAGAVPFRETSSISVASEARFQDTYLVGPLDSETFIYTPGTLDFYFDVTGTFQTTSFFNPGDSSAQIYGYSIVNGRNGRTVASTPSTLEAPGRMKISFPIVFGVPITIEIAFQASSRIAQNFTTGIFSETDLRRTAVLSQVIARDGSGTPLAFTLNTESGSPNYSGVVLGDASVPEPGTALAVALGLVVVLRRRL
jgi:hypothetical protein